MLLQGSLQSNFSQHMVNQLSNAHELLMLEHLVMVLHRFLSLAVCRREGKPPFFLPPLGRMVGIRSLPTPHLVAEMGLTINALPHTFVLSDKLLGKNNFLVVRKIISLTSHNDRKRMRGSE